jgi:hypothetical protein
VYIYLFILNVGLYYCIKILNFYTSPIIIVIVIRSNLLIPAMTATNALLWMNTPHRGLYKIFKQFFNDVIQPFNWRGNLFTEVRGILYINAQLSLSLFLKLSQYLSLSLTFKLSNSILLSNSQSPSISLSHLSSSCDTLIEALS